MLTTQNSQRILKNSDRVEELTLPNIKNYCKATAIKTAWHKGKTNG